MQVNVFISTPPGDGKPPQLLVLPIAPEAAIPEHLRQIDWRYFATTDANESLIGAPDGEVEVAIARDGYMLTRSVGL